MRPTVLLRSISDIAPNRVDLKCTVKYEYIEQCDAIEFRMWKIQNIWTESLYPGSRSGEKQEEYRHELKENSQEASMEGVANYEKKI